MNLYIATAVDFSIQIQMNQWKIVWLPVWIKCDILSGVVLYFIRVHSCELDDDGKYEPTVNYYYFYGAFHTFLGVDYSISTN